MTCRPELRPATPGDIEAFYGGAPHPEMRAYVAELEGRVIGIGGTYRHDGRDVAFSDLKPEMKRYRRAIVEGARLFQREFGACIALADPQEPGAERLLTRLGFQPYDAIGGKAFVRYG